MSVLPWQEPLAEGLSTRIRAGQLPHAVLITGPEGWGEQVLANWLALTLLGLDPGRDASTLAHPDLRWIVPEGAMIKVDAVRELVEFAHGTPQSGSRKVAVVAEAHFLNQSSANAMLKTLEEPPAGTHLVLFSAHPGRLLPTIRSRCQTVAIRPDAVLARRWLETRAPGEDLDQRMFEHGGAPVAVLTALERGERPLDGVIETALDTRDTGAVVKALLEAGLAGTLARWYRYVLALAAGQWRPRRLSGASARAVVEFAEELTWVRRQLVTSNSVNERLMAERLVARWRQLARSTA